MKGEKVFVESPLAATSKEESTENIEYAKRCLRDCLRRGEYPFASHLLYPQVLDDTIPAERFQGMEAGEAWRLHADRVVIYIDRGISAGMEKGVFQTIRLRIPREVRTLNENSTS